jgi:hypothetical protein
MIGAKLLFCASCKEKCRCDWEDNSPFWPKLRGRMDIKVEAFIIGTDEKFWKARQSSSNFLRYMLSLAKEVKAWNSNGSLQLQPCGKEDMG